MEERITLFVEVLLPIATPMAFTYRVPFALNDEVEVGKRVVVQFGKSKILSGLIVGIGEKPPEVEEVKYIMDILDQNPVVNATQLKFWNWIAEYYMCCTGEVMQAALPSAMKLTSESRIMLSPEYVIDSQALNDYEYLIVEALQLHPKLTISEVSRIIGYKKVMPLVKTMIDKNIILMEEELDAKYKAKYERYMRLSQAYRDETMVHELMDNLTKRAFKQLELLLSFLALGGDADNDLPAKDVLKKADANATVLKSMVEKGIFDVYERRVSRLKNFKSCTDVDSIDLSEAQQKALDDIEAGFESKRPVLLHGVTSSGKTEIYIKLIKKALDEGKQVLYLLPEIALTSQIINRLRKYFGDSVGIYHSRYGTNERVEVWEQVNNFAITHTSSHRVIVGSRSSLFLPYSDLGLVIVDEEHDASFKQVDPAPRYNARDAAVVLAHLHNAKILLGSATPSYESYHNALSGRYALAEITERYGGVEMPEIILSDMRVERKRKTIREDFGSTLVDAMHQTIEEGNQVILFQNRRGFALRLECDQCHYIPQCINCDVSLIYHKSQNVLRCHYCGYTTSLPTECPNCHSASIRMHGYGTEKIEEEIKTVVPEASTLRLDLDTTRTRNDYQSILESFQNKESNVLVGTQMVTKGLDFNSVKLVGILNADAMLSYPDFRAHERSFQLMSQVSGRAGRRGGQGKVIIQTYEPYHTVLQDVLQNNYRALYDRQMPLRQQFKYPPFYRIILIRLKHTDLAKLNQAADALASELRGIFGSNLLGPEFPVVTRVRNQFIKQMMIKFKRENNSREIKRLISDKINGFKANYDFKSVVIQVDVDPI